MAQLEERDVPGLDQPSIDQAKALIGINLRRQLHHTRATKPAISAWVRSIGDRNPLFLEESYANKATYGRIVAPPLFLYSVDDTVLAPKLAGIHAIYAAVSWEFFKPIRLGDEFTSEARLTHVLQKTGRFCGEFIAQTGDVLYRNQRDQIIGIAKPTIFRTPRKAAEESHKYSYQKKKWDYDGRDSRK